MRNHALSPIGLMLGGALCGRAQAEENPAQGVCFGLNCFLSNLRYCEIRASLVKPTAEDRTRYLDAVRDTGEKAVRETFMNWAPIEPERGVPCQFEPFDDIGRKASDRGIEITALAYPAPCRATGAAPTPLDQLLTPMWQLPKRSSSSASSDRGLAACFRWPDGAQCVRPVHQLVTTASNSSKVCTVSSLTAIPRKCGMYVPSTGPSSALHTPRKRFMSKVRPVSIHQVIVNHPSSV